MVFTSIGYNLARLFTFSGRETRRLFWPYAIGVFLAGMLLNFMIVIPVLMNMMEGLMAYSQQHPEGPPPPQPGQLPALPPELMPDFGSLILPSAVIALVSMLLLAAAVVRRLHDRDRAGWWGLLPVPFKLAGLAAGPAVTGALTHPPGGTPLAATGSPLVMLGSLNSLAYWIAFIVLVVMLVGEGTRGPNRFGDDPPGA
jgi:uncharacterized membrane protein YhaH (DUF805 family)